MKISQDVRNFIYDYRRFHGKKKKVFKTDIHNSEMQSRTAFKERFLFLRSKSISERNSSNYTVALMAVNPTFIQIIAISLDTHTTHQD